MKTKTIVAVLLVVLILVTCAPTATSQANNVICILPLILISCAAEPISDTEKLVLKVERSELLRFPIIRLYVADIVGNGKLP